jgi:di/tripeptidase
MQKSLMLTSRMLAVQKKHLELEKMQRSWEFKKDPQIYLKVRKMLKEIGSKTTEEERIHLDSESESKKMLLKERK